MASSDKELEEKLFEAGNKLVDPPSSVDELLPLLDQVESCLSRVEQSPIKSMQNALSPSLKALISNELLRHSDPDVKVAVASCISEITRITAPDAPYDDDQMKEVFQLIVSSFENLSDKSSRSYTKRTSILETVAKVRSCVVMLDLECDALILEMFQHFLKAIREYHPGNVFSSMETIMNLVLEESEDIPAELLSPILDSVKNDNKEVLPSARKLGERVLESCSTKLKPYLVQAVKNLGISLDDYSKVLSSICEEAPGNVEQNDIFVTSEHVAGESKSAGSSLEEATQEDKAIAAQAASPQEANPSNDKSPKSVMSNGITLAGEGESSADPVSLKKEEEDHRPELSKDVNVSSHGGPDDLGAERTDDTEQKSELTIKKRGRRSNSSMKSSKPSESPSVDDDKEVEKLRDSKSVGKDVPSLSLEDPSAEAAGPTENEKEVDGKPLSPKAVDDEPEIVAFPSPNESIPNELHSKKPGRAKKKDSLTKEAAMSTDDVSRLVSEGTSDSEVKPNRCSGKSVIGGSSNVKKTITVDSNKKGSGTTSDTEAKNQSAKKVGGTNKVLGGSSSKQPEDKKTRGRVKAISAKVEVKSFKDDDKEMVFSPKAATKSTKNECQEETPKTDLKRKRTSSKDKSEIKEYGENLVGARVKVWWPMDKEFYEGIIDSYDSVKQKHKISYNDGENEILNLRRQIFEIIEDGTDSDEDEGTNHASRDTSANMPPEKKRKINTGESTKLAKMDTSPKSGGRASTNRSKGAAKSSSRSKDGGRVDRKSKDSKTVSKSEDNIGGKSKDQTPVTGSNRSVDTAPKTIGKPKNAHTAKTSKSKDDAVSTLRPSVKSKQETLKTGKSKQETSNTDSGSKGKPPKSGGKPNSNDAKKGKSSLSKGKARESDDSNDSSEGQENPKGKSPKTSKTQSAAKTGKKRRRG
ncbi:Sister chromatid cohesion protein PDS5-like B-B [Quillaja saponaria]|uniref:Sister chromatid cohesion protein PDS5-like B-B n=1 Tax=Quillaja saponaria TaxID=32244 RepID=A0AAD7LI13_QUISA|nr:Sister chromatid cohesion protein PDS5-like B-B [Quillaja saponaria]